MKYRKLLNLLAIVSLAAGLFTGFLAPKASLASEAAAIPSHNLAVSETGLYIVRLQDPSVVTYKGGIRGLAATSPEATGAQKLDTSTAASQAYYNYLADKQQGLLTAMGNAYGRTVEAEYQYLYVLNAVAVRITHAEALQAFNLPGVITVYPDEFKYINTDEGPLLIGADAIWDGETYPDEAGVQAYGEGIIIGVLDTGINNTHPSFAATGGDGYTHTNPYGTFVYHGWCVAHPGYCSEKLIGAWNFVEGDGDDVIPDDDHGHGSHTASTAGGNVLDANFTFNGTSITRPISGVAPHANIVAYRVCTLSGCPNSASVAAVNQAIEDQVDVINYSIGPGGDPWTDVVEVAFLEATDNGIFVSTSAGNSGPGDGSIEHHAPWTSSVAATIHGRILNNNVDVTLGEITLANIPSFVAGDALITSDFTDNIKYDPAYNGCAEIPAGTYAGLIALVERGGCAFVDKAENAVAAGASGIIFYSNQAGPPPWLGPLGISIPATSITQADGEAIIALIGSNLSATATIHADTTVLVNQDWADVMTNFSSRGPTDYNLLKPDYAAPGYAILAAIMALPGDFTRYGFMSGTSMSSPHSAGAAALMMELRPEWSPAEIRSALATTANPDTLLDLDGSPAGTWAEGSGRLDLSLAGNASLIMDETHSDFLAADPALGGHPEDLNMPYLVNYNCIDTCTWTRTVTSVMLENTIWEVVIPPTPAGLTLTSDTVSFELTQGNPNASFTITADVTAGTLDDYFFAEVLLVPDEGTPTRLPVVVMVDAPPPVISVDPLAMDSTQFADTLVDQDLTISNLGIRDLDWELYGIPLGWSDNFDSYELGTINDQGGWKGWAGDPDAAGEVSDAEAFSLEYSQAIADAADSVHEYSGFITGQWTYTAMQFIPNDFDGESMFILLNGYDDTGATDNWSTTVSFDSGSGLVQNLGVTPGSLPMIQGQWVELRVEIDMDLNTQEFYYNDTLLFSGTWTEEISGGGALNIAAVDLFANGASVIYYDDISIATGMTEYCELPENIPWLDMIPTSGTVVQATSGLATVTFDSTGLADGSYSSYLCVVSNDRATPLVMIPVTLDVIEKFENLLPLMFKMPAP